MIMMKARTGKIPGNKGSLSGTVIISIPNCCVFWFNVNVLETFWSHKSLFCLFLLRWYLYYQSLQIFINYKTPKWAGGTQISSLFQLILHLSIWQIHVSRLNRARNPFGSFVYALDCLKELSTVSWKLELAARWLERPLLAGCKSEGPPAKLHFWELAMDCGLWGGRLTALWSVVYLLLLFSLLLLLSMEAECRDVSHRSTQPLVVLGL